MKRIFIHLAVVLTVVALCVALTLLRRDLPQVGDTVTGIQVPGDSIWSIAVDPESVGLELSQIVHSDIGEGGFLASLHSDDDRLRGSYTILENAGGAARVMRPTFDVTGYPDEMCVVIDFARAKEFEILPSSAD